MAAAAVPDMSQYIMRTEAQSEIGRLVQEQLETFTVQKKVIEEQSQQAQNSLIAITAEP